MVTVCRAVIGGIGVAQPPSLSQAQLWEGFFSAHYAGVARGLAKRIFEHSGVDTRHAVINPLVEDPSGWPTGLRMQRYLVEALPLGKDAVSAALDRAGVAASEVGMLVVCSCTGYVTPGLDILLARDLGLPPDARRVFVGHMGCYAALPGLGVAARLRGAQRSAGGAAVCGAAEPACPAAHRGSAAGGGACAVLGRGGGGGAGAGRPGRAVAEVASLTDTTTADHMTWHVTDLGFRMGLSAQVPDVLARYVGPLVSGLLDRHGLTVAGVGGLGGAPRWPAHPGRGPASSWGSVPRPWRLSRSAWPSTATVPRRPYC